MLNILKFWSPYFLIISCRALFKVQYHKNYSMKIKNFFSHLKLMKLPLISNIDSKIKIIWIFKKHEKTVIFLIFTDIKRHNFK